MNSRLGHVFDLDGTEEEFYVEKFAWSETNFEGVYCRTQDRFLRYRERVVQKNNERTELLIDEYFKSNSKNMKRSIAWYLPKKIGDYPEYLFDKASRYFDENEK